MYHRGANAVLKLEYADHRVHKSQIPLRNREILCRYRTQPTLTKGFKRSEIMHCLVQVAFSCFFMEEDIAKILSALASFKNVLILRTVLVTDQPVDILGKEAMN